MKEKTWFHKISSYEYPLDEVIEAASIDEAMTKLFAYHPIAKESKKVVVIIEGKKDLKKFQKIKFVANGEVVPEYSLYDPKVIPEYSNTALKNLLGHGEKKAVKKEDLEEEEKASNKFVEFISDITDGGDLVYTVLAAGWVSILLVCASVVVWVVVVMLISIFRGSPSTYVPEIRTHEGYLKASESERKAWTQKYSNDGNYPGDGEEIKAALDAFYSH